MLAHYHELGTGMTFEAIRDSDNTAHMMFETATRIGDGFAALLDPPFDLTGHSKIRFACEYDNPRDTSVGWGVGDQEMCILFAFTDSPLEPLPRALVLVRARARALLLAVACVFDLIVEP